LESLATQTLIIFAIRTRRVPFLRSRPSGALAIATIAVVAIGAALTMTPVSRGLGFTPLPWQFFAALGALAVGYLLLVEAVKLFFYTEPMRMAGSPRRTRGSEHRVQRRAARFSHPGRLPGVDLGARTR
jgi:Mg2+-importing ATPase